MLWFVYILLGVLILYHHLIYLPLILRLGKEEKDPVSPLTPTEKPTLGITMCAYNEAHYIEDKMANLLMLDYPADKLKIFVLCDGCTDDTAKRIQRWQPKFAAAGIELTLIEQTTNRGKLESINHIVPLACKECDLVALTDVSALISVDALQQAVLNFQDNRVGAVTSQYLLADGLEGEQQYWRWQNKIRNAESNLGSVIGGNGAFYVLRSSLFQPLPLDTINDDFMLPMQVIQQGYQVILNQNINSVELEPTSLKQDEQRRKRIGAGNLQQLIRCRFLLHPSYLNKAWLFFSGKGLRTVMPLLLFVFAALSIVLALQGSSIALVMIIAQTVGYGLALLPEFGIRQRILTKLNYILRSYVASLSGMMAYVKGEFSQGWRRQIHVEDYQSRITRTAKRTSDIVISLTGLLLTLPLWPCIALAIKLDSPGPIFFRQIRVGQISHDKVELFHMIKFRTMVQDAEKASGAVWATKNDPRITRLGRFLRETRLDEIPQFLNVLKGEMSMVGPRPERPEFCHRLQNALPYYAERTAGLKPGITGLAQVTTGYDGSVDDVKQKLQWDHAYSVSLSSPKNWLYMDFFILVKTVGVILNRHGQ
uniref:sugar transferase n=1 Tax=Thaumasiovibrio occultus TaxID=1891184 RepID=UPI000B360A6C|nr:sugar transferase [Thaumasiovibrio occultus]